MATKTIPQGTTAHDVLEGITAKRWTKATAVGFLTQRCEAAIDAGRIPRKASVDALAKLGVTLDFERDTLRTRKQIARKTPTLRERREAAASKPKAAKRKAPAKRKAKPNAKPDAEAAIAELLEQFGETEALVAFTKLIAKQ